jgi:hypothetical protein
MKAGMREQRESGRESVRVVGPSVRLHSLFHLTSKVGLRVVNALNSPAWILAAQKDAAVSNGTETVRLAERQSFHPLGCGLPARSRLSRPPQLRTTWLALERIGA